MKKYISQVEPGEQIKVCGRFYSVVQSDNGGLMDTRLILFPMSGKILSPVILNMRQDVKIPVYPSRKIQVLQ